MATTKVLITVKTYPSLSCKYDELVCTAGFLEDGRMVRIYPVQFRKRDYDQQYKKYDWIELDLVKNTSDFRPESFRPVGHSTPINIIGHLNTDHNWAERKPIVLHKVYDDLTVLIDEAHNKEICTSLAVFKPKEIIDFVAEKVSSEWDKEKLAIIEAERKQLGLFDSQEDRIFQVVKKLPFKFSYILTDKNGKQSKMMIEDWEIGQLFWNCLARHEGNENKAVADVRKKYFDDFAKTKDLHLFLGTTKLNHYVSKNPFMIIGTFHPKKGDQLSLF